MTPSRYSRLVCILTPLSIIILTIVFCCVGKSDGIIDAETMLRKAHESQKLATDYSDSEGDGDEDLLLSLIRQHGIQ